MRKTKRINRVICGDCFDVLPYLPTIAGRPITMVFADPPDNLGVKYAGYRDARPGGQYEQWLRSLIAEMMQISDIAWLSFYHKYLGVVVSEIDTATSNYESVSWRLFLWRFTFGQHNNNDCGNGFRPILRIVQGGKPLFPRAIRVPSARQTKYHDKRANPRGRVPDDVWEFPRVCGTFKEKRAWHVNQHPEALIERIVRFSVPPGGLVVDLFAGSGTTGRVCARLGLDWIGVEISARYCKHIASETGAEVVRL